MKTKRKILEEYGRNVGFFALPGERDLAEKYGVSRPTLHKALLLLENEGKIVRIIGKGSFFMGEKKFTNLSHTRVIGFRDMISQSGRLPKEKILIQNVEAADAEVAKALVIKEGDQVFHLKSLLYINDELYAMVDDYISLSLLPSLFKQDFAKTTVVAEMEKGGFFTATMKGLLEVKPANTYEALHLDIKVGDPIAIFRNIGYDTSGRIISLAIVRSLAYETSYEIYTEHMHPN
jgi:Transcriptional regulators